MDMQTAKGAASNQTRASARQLETVRRACGLIDAQEGERLTLSEIAGALDTSRPALTMPLGQ